MLRNSLLAVNSISSVPQARGFATLKDISLRLKSIRNIQKITKSMKMVSAAKYAKAERDLKGARSYGEGAQAFYNNLDIEPVTEASTAAPGTKRLLILITSDRGLCGGVHSSVAREARKILLNKQADVEYKVACIGDKSRVILSRLYSQQILFSGNEIGRAPPTFEDASIAANAILNSGYEYDEGSIIFNRFNNVVSYTTKHLPLVPLASVRSNEKINDYDSVDDDVLQSYTEYSLAQLIYYAMKEGATSEQSSRLNTMGNATKSAGEMIDKLQMVYNRTRQAAITRELIEIMAGASCV